MTQTATKKYKKAAAKVIVSPDTTQTTNKTMGKAKHIRSKNSGNLKKTRARATFSRQVIKDKRHVLAGILTAGSGKGKHVPAFIAEPFNQITILQQDQHLME